MTGAALELSLMTWPEAREALARAECAIIPTGSFEQHAPFMTFTVDTARALGFSRLLAARLAPRVVLAPAIPFGVSFHHLGFPGTITLRNSTFHALLRDVVWSLSQHGLRQFFIVNGHGGNAPALQEMIVELRQELGLRVAWSGPTTLGSAWAKANLTDNSGHCGQNETSQAMFLAPEVVRPERIVKGATKPYPYRHLKGEGGGVQYPYTWNEITDNGALGDATLATAELGRGIAEAGLIKAAEFLVDFMDKNAALDRRPPS